MTMNKKQECQENFLKIQQGCNKKSILSRKKLNKGITKIKVAEKKIKQRYNKNQG